MYMVGKGKSFYLLTYFPLHYARMGLTYPLFRRKSFSHHGVPPILRAAQIHQFETYIDTYKYVCMAAIYIYVSGLIKISSHREAFQIPIKHAFPICVPLTFWEQQQILKLA